MQSRYIKECNLMKKIKLQSLQTQSIIKFTLINQS